jgi:putative ABC transport system permease protein
MNFLNELRYTLRVMSKNIKFTLLCVTVIAIGLGLVLPMYALVDNLAFKSPPYPDGDRYVGLNKILTPGGRPTGLATFDTFHYRYFKDNSRSFQDMHAWQNINLTLSDGEYVEIYQSAVIEPDLLQMPAVRPEMGRLFTVEDVESGAAPVAIIGNDVWQFYYAGRTDIIGHQARINGENRTIVGVMPADFTFPLTQQIWLPLALPATANAGEGVENLVIAGKLAAGVKAKQATSEIALFEANILRDNPELYPTIESVDVVPYVQITNALSEGSTRISLLLLSVIVLVTINVGNLFIARGEERTTELAIRSALGATPARLAQSVLLESFVVCLCGLLLGLTIAWFGIAYVENFVAIASAGRITGTFWWDASLNGRLIATSTLVVSAIWLGSAGLPAWRISRANLQEQMAGSGKGLVNRGNSRVIALLVNLQLIVGCMMLTVGIVQVISFSTGRINALPDPDLLYAATISFANTTLMTTDARLAYLDNVQRNLVSEPGINSVAVTSAAPLAGLARTAAFAMEDADLRTNDTYPEVVALATSANYLSILNRAIVSGRGFSAADAAGTLPVAIIDERLANQYWPGQSAVGKRIQLDPGANARWLTVVGVSQPFYMERRLYPGQKGTPLVYIPVSQSTPMRLNLVVKFDSPPEDAQMVIRKVANAVHRDVPVTEFASFRALGARADEGDTFNFNLFVGFIIFALYLTGAATYGMAARAAGKRRVETGIRMALGASSGASMQVFIKDGFKMVVTGLGIGGTAAVLFSYWSLSNNGTPVNVSAYLIPTVIFLSLAMGSVVMLANYFPAKKIIAMEPGEALRHE